MTWSRKSLLLVSAIMALLLFLLVFFGLFCRASLGQVRQAINNEDFSLVEYGYCTRVAEGFLVLEDIDWATVKGDRLDKAMTLLSGEWFYVELKRNRSLDLLFDELRSRGISLELTTLVLNDCHGNWQGEAAPATFGSFNSRYIEIDQKIATIKDGLDLTRLMIATFDKESEITLRGFKELSDEEKAALKAMQDAGKGDKLVVH